MDRRMDGQYQSNMLSQLLQIWGHKYGQFMKSNDTFQHIH